MFLIISLSLLCEFYLRPKMRLPSLTVLLNLLWLSTWPPDSRMCTKLRCHNELWIQFAGPRPGLIGWRLNAQVWSLAFCVCIVEAIYVDLILQAFVLRSVSQACLLIKDVPSARTCLVAGSSPWHLTAVSTDNAGMDFPAEIGFKRHVSGMFDIKIVLFIVFTGRAIHIKHTARSFRSF